MDIFRREIAFGLTPFETIYFENKSPHLLYEHFKRLKRASRVFETLFSHDFENFKNEINDFLNNHDSCSGVLKVVILDGKLHFNVRQPSYSKEKFNDGFRLTVSKVIRDENNIINYFKTFNYGINFIEDNRAKARGYDGTVFLNLKKQFCETSYANIFFRKGKKLYTPNLSCGLLKGIMRDSVINFAKRNGYPVEKGFIGVEDVKVFDECFITNSVAGVFPIASINEICFKQRNFSNLISKEACFKRDWNKNIDK